ncbi:hypothetical protein BC830DRAFT_1090515 [Chytriomyces sp. MP71]|nr:hypothetical protein BC830DRAFT_1090515 [Chytriomyces sp. MP71]
MLVHKMRQNRKLYLVWIKLLVALRLATLWFPCAGSLVPLLVLAVSVVVSLTVSLEATRASSIFVWRGYLMEKVIVCGSGAL